MKQYIIDQTEEEIRAQIDQGLTIRDKEKDKFGEVFTPAKLIDEILDALPADVWRNPDAKWLDPAAGRGYFGALVYIRLFNTLRSKIPDDAVRSKHILENMLYMVEINPASVHGLRKWFGHKARISLADFLNQEGKWRRDLDLDRRDTGIGLDRRDLDLDRRYTGIGLNRRDTGLNINTGAHFDVILGNPPFQSSKIEVYEGSVGHRTLWDKFILATLPLLKPCGHLGFITPAGWRRPKSTLYQSMVKENRLKYLHIYGKADGISIFGAETRFDVYVIERVNPVSNPDDTIQYESKECDTEHPKNPIIIDELGKTHRNIKAHMWPFLPNYAYKEIKRILVDPMLGIPVLFHAGDYDARHLATQKTKKMRYPIVHGITKEGLGLRFSNKRIPRHFGQPKVLLNFNEKQYPYNDYRGQYGMSQLTFGIPIKSKAEGERWIRAITSPAFETILKATKWSAFQTDYRMFQFFNRRLLTFPEFSKTRKRK